MHQKLLLLELNELNFECVQFYCRRGLLPGFARLFADHGWGITTSETAYHELEPWIQWVTAHTGKPLSDHGVFRLGDIVHHDIEQIWERIESAGLKVGAFSPMNANNRLRQSAFFVPDPWTRTSINARPSLRRLFEAIVQVVDDNAQARVSARSAAYLLCGLLIYARAENYAEYFRLMRKSARQPWARAIFLDLLLSDVFITEMRRTRPHFASLFLNAGAHLQHHYYFSAACYDGPFRNPPWYLDEGTDPLFETYRIYDRTLQQLRTSFPDSRIMIATGLRQVPHSRVTFYWRLKNHAEFLRRMRIPFNRVEPRMSRDFLVTCDSPEDARHAATRLLSATAADGTPLFEVDNRGSTLFVTLTYSRDITDDFVFQIGGEAVSGFRKDVAFVALKNGEHDGTGYFSDTGQRLEYTASSFPLAQLPDRIEDALGIAPRVGAVPCATA